MSDKSSQTHRANRSFIDVGVTVAVAAQFDLGVVQMEATKTSEADAHIDLVHEFVRTMGARIVITTRP
jgi:hypothetical protein